MPRVMCVWFPFWPIQRLHAALSGPEGQTPAGSEFSSFPRRSLGSRDSSAASAKVLYTEKGQRGQRVAVCCAVARAGGVRPGMPLAEARTLLEGGRNSARRAAPQFLPLDPEADRAALRQLAWQLLEFSPHVGLDDIEPPESLVLDLSGCASLFGGEEALVRQLRQRMQAQRLQLRLAVADTLGAAWAAARFSPRPHTFIPPGEQRRHLEPWSPAALRLSAATVTMLEELGLETIGQLLQLPRSTLPSRFGPEIGQRLDQAFEGSQETIVCERPPEPIAFSRRFEWPLEDRRQVERVLCQLLEEIVKHLHQKALAVQRLEGLLEDACGKQTALPVGLVSLTASPKRLEDLLRLKWETLPVTAGIVAVSLRAIDPRPLPRKQGTLFDTGEETAAGEWEALLERLGNRLGEEAVVRAEPVSDYQPELAFRFVPVTSLESRTMKSGKLSDLLPGLRPLCLVIPPQPVSVVASPRTGTPCHVRWPGGESAVARCWGPERIETGWWRTSGIRRDYYRVETDDGRWLWLYRDLVTNRWWLHGTFE